MLSVTNKPLMLNVIMLNVVMMCVVALLRLLFSKTCKKILPSLIFAGEAVEWSVLNLPNGVHLNQFIFYVLKSPCLLYVSNSFSQNFLQFTIQWFISFLKLLILHSVTVTP